MMTWLQCGRERERACLLTTITTTTTTISSSKTHFTSRICRGIFYSRSTVLVRERSHSSALCSPRRVRRTATRGNMHNLSLCTCYGAPGPIVTSPIVTSPITTGPTAAASRTTPLFDSLIYTSRLSFGASSKRDRGGDLDFRGNCDWNFACCEKSLGKSRLAEPRPGRRCCGAHRRQQRSIY